MSLRDVATFLNAHATMRTDYLSEASYIKLRTVPFGGIYSLGWIAPPNTASRFHNGSNTMWYAEVGFDPTTGVVAGVTVNDGDIVGLKDPVRNVLRELLAWRK